MRRIVPLFLTLVASSILVVLAASWKHNVAVHANSCSVATLTGNYGVSWQGFDILTTGQHYIPWAGVGVLNFDGSGNVSARWTQSLNGRIMKRQTGAGTYRVDSHCTGSFVFKRGDGAGETADLVLVDGGTEVLAIATLSTQTIVLDAKKQ